MAFEISDENISILRSLISEGSTTDINRLIEDIHQVDLAIIVKKLEIEEVLKFFELIHEDLVSEIISELEEEDREEILANLSNKTIAERVIEHMESDDAADLIHELPDERKEEVIGHIEDLEQASAIIDLLGYPEDSAGGLMAKELFKVDVNWDVLKCVSELKKQAEDIGSVHSVYAVDELNVLLGTISLKKLVLTPSNTQIIDIINSDIISVKTSATSQEAANLMDKYDLVVLPVVDEINRLVGRITIDDVVDVIIEEAEKDYQMASGLADNVEEDDTIFEITKARFPWLLVGLMGGVVSAQIIGIFDIEKNPILALFIPLIAAMGGNVGVQSAAIVVQGLANNTIKTDDIFSKLVKETGVALVNGILCSTILFLFNWFLFEEENAMLLSLTISISLLSVIIFAAIFGTYIPLTLNRLKIDPALATGPFITTANDIFGLFLYFYIGHLILG